MRLPCKGRSRSGVGEGAFPPSSASGLAVRRSGSICGVPFIFLLLLLLPGWALPSSGAAQVACAGIPPGGSAAPSLQGYVPLFRQAGVSFLTRIPGDPPPARASLAVANGNAYPVVVDFGIRVVIGADSAAPREVALGRRCVSLAAGQAVELPAAVEGSAPGERVRTVRVLNLDISGLPSGAPAPLPGGTPPAPGGPALAAQPGQPPEAAYGCAAAEGSAADACTAAYLAASARAAVLTGGFAGTTRACLIEYATLQERAAELLRRGDPAGEALSAQVPLCFSRESARWDFAMLERLCPGGRWTAENQGTPACETPGVVVAAPAEPAPDSPAAAGPPEGREIAAPPAAPPPPEEAAAAEEPRSPIDLQLILRLLFGSVLSMAALGLFGPILRGLALLLVVAPTALLRRAVGGAVPK